MNADRQKKALLFHVGSWIALLAVTLSVKLIANPQTDKLYSFRDIIAVVLDADRDPIFAETVENEVVRYLRSQSRFYYDDAAYVQMKELLRTEESSASRGGGRERLKGLFKQIEQVKKKGVDSIIFVELKPNPEDYHVALYLLNTNNMDVLLNTEISVEDQNLADSFVKAVHLGLLEMLKQLPFDGTILSREGYRVVIDRGNPDFHPMQEIPAFTVERREDGSVSLEETGLIVLTQVDDNISFGKVIVEKRPREITVGNKILIPERITLRRLGLAERPPPHPRQFGFVDVRLGASALSASSTPAAGGVGSSASLIYPGLDLNGELWITNRLFVQAGFSLGIWTLASTSNTGTVNENSTVSNGQFLVGYRVPIFDPNLGLKVSFVGGFARDEFQVDTSSGSLSLRAMRTRGFTLAPAWMLLLRNAFLWDFSWEQFSFHHFPRHPLRAERRSPALRCGILE